MRHSRIILGLLAVFVFNLSVFAQEEAETVTPQIPEAPEKNYRVAVKSTPPFAFQNESGEWVGISVDLWKIMAKDLGWDFTFQPVATLDELLAQAVEGKVDVALGAISATAERERILDLTHSYFSTGQALAIRPAVQGKWVWLKNLLSLEFLAALGGLAMLLGLTGFAIWLVERKKNPADFGGHWWEGIGAGFWWSAVTMTTVGYGDKAPKTVLGRVVGLVWMFAGLILISGMTAAIASALTVQNLGGSLSRSQKFSEWRIATVKGSSGERFALDQGWTVSSFSALPLTFEAIKAGSVDAILYDRISLEYFLSQDSSLKCEILPGSLNSESYSLALPSGSPIRDTLNIEILKVVNKKLIHDIQKSYMEIDEV